MALKFTLFGNTNVGSVRDHNEDNFAVCCDLSEKLWSFSKDEARSLSEMGAVLIVADGMGGTNAGEVASDIAQNSVKEAFNKLEKIPESQKEREQVLKKMVVQAHQDVVKHQEENLETAGMGTTLVIAWVIDGMLHAAWSGDSRCYIYDAGSPFLPFTDDHSIVWDLVKKGDLTSEEARLHPNSNIINQSLGDPKNGPSPDAKSRKLYKGSKILVCSDGLNGMISDDEIEAYIKSTDDVAQICRSLVDAANAAGGHDNITCLLMDIKEGAAAPAEPIQPSSGPTNTAVLRNKVKFNRGIIGVLIAAILLLAFFLFKSDSTETTELTKSIYTVEIGTEGNQQIDLNQLASGKVWQIEKLNWDASRYELNGMGLTLHLPIAATDTLFISYTIPDKEGNYEAALVFVENAELKSTEPQVNDAPDVPASSQSSESDGAINSESNTPPRETHTPPRTETQPRQAVDTARVRAPKPVQPKDTPRTAPQRPRITPINPITQPDTTK